MGLARAQPLEEEEDDALQFSRALARDVWGCEDRERERNRIFFFAFFQFFFFRICVICIFLHLFFVLFLCRVI